VLSTGLIVQMSVVILAAAAFVYRPSRERISSFLFSREPTIDLINELFVCPRCLSKDWTFPNPLYPTDSMINHPHLVNNFRQCMDCSYIGIFFIVDREYDADIIRVECKGESTPITLLALLFYTIVATIAISLVGFFVGDYLGLAILWRIFRKP
jgi:hypothetical protein